MSKALNFIGPDEISSTVLLTALNRLSNEYAAVQNIDKKEAKKKRKILCGRLYGIEFSI